MRHIRVVHGAPVLLAEQNCFEFSECGQIPQGKVKIRLEKDCMFMEFESDDWEDGRICFNWPVGAFEGKKQGRWLAKLSYGECERWVQFEIAGCAQANHHIKKTDCV